MSTHVGTWENTVARGPHSSRQGWAEVLGLGPRLQSPQGAVFFSALFPNVKGYQKIRNRVSVSKQ